MHNKFFLDRLSWILILGFLLASCGVKTKNLSPEASCGFVQEDRQRLSWKETPIVVSLSKTVPEQLHAPIRQAFDTWNTAFGRTLFKFGGISNETSVVQDGVNLIVIGPNPDEHEQASTRLYWTGSTITEADITVSPSILLATSQIDLESLILHEAGHVLGLDHKIESSVMTKSLGPGEIRRTPTSTDIRNLSCEY